MKDIAPKLVQLLKLGYCTPQISRLAKKLQEPSTTIHYNIKKLEKDKVIREYKAVFDYKKINQGHCTYVLANLIPEKYGNPIKGTIKYGANLEMRVGITQFVNKCECKPQKAFKLE